MKLTKEQELMQSIMNEAWESEDFKKELVSNPIEAIEKLTGEKISLPEGKQLVITDQTDEKTIYINIPSEPNMEDIELNEEQLEAVAGGTETPAQRESRERFAAISFALRAFR